VLGLTECHSRQPPVTVASLRLFLRSSTGPNRRFQPQSLGRVRDPVRIVEGPTAVDAATQRRHFGFRLWLVDKFAANRWGERTGPPTLWYLGNVDGPNVMPTKQFQQPASLMTPLPRHERKAL